MSLDPSKGIVKGPAIPSVVPVDERVVLPKSEPLGPLPPCFDWAPHLRGLPKLPPAPETERRMENVLSGIWALGRANFSFSVPRSSPSNLGLLTGFATVGLSCAFLIFGRGNISPLQAKIAGTAAIMGLFGTTVFATGDLNEVKLPSLKPAARPPRPILPGAMPAGQYNKDPLDDSDIYPDGGENPSWKVQTSRRTALQFATSLTVVTGCLLGACLLISRPQLAEKLLTFVARV